MERHDRKTTLVVLLLGLAGTAAVAALQQHASSDPLKAPDIEKLLIVAVPVLLVAAALTFWRNELLTTFQRPIGRVRLLMAKIPRYRVRVERTNPPKMTSQIIVPDQLYEMTRYDIRPVGDVIVAPAQDGFGEFASLRVTNKTDTRGSFKVTAQLLSIRGHRLTSAQHTGYWMPPWKDINNAITIDLVPYEAGIVDLAESCGDLLVPNSMSHDGRIDFLAVWSGHDKPFERHKLFSAEWAQGHGNIEAVVYISLYRMGIDGPIFRNTYIVESERSNWGVRVRENVPRLTPGPVLSLLRDFSEEPQEEPLSVEMQVLVYRQLADGTEGEVMAGNYIIHGHCDGHLIVTQQMIDAPHGVVAVDIGPSGCLTVRNTDESGKFWAEAAILCVCAKEGRVDLYGHPVKPSYKVPWLKHDDAVISLKQGAAATLMLARMGAPVRSRKGRGCVLEVMGVIKADTDPT
jgi:hypothetical protein